MKTIEIHTPTDPAREHRVYFKDRTGRKVYANVEDPQMYLDMRQKELYFMGIQYRFEVPESTITNLERLINWPI